MTVGNGYDQGPQPGWGEPEPAWGAPPPQATGRAHSGRWIRRGSKIVIHGV